MFLTSEAKPGGWGETGLDHDELLFRAALTDHDVACIPKVWFHTCFKKFIHVYIVLCVYMLLYTRTYSFRRVRDFTFQFRGLWYGGLGFGVWGFTFRFQALGFTFLVDLSPSGRPEYLDHPLL